MKILKLFLTLTLSFNLLYLPVAMAGEVAFIPVEGTPYDLSQVILPSEASQLSKYSSSLYYSPVAKGKALMPINMWGEIEKCGLHYIPVNTCLIDGIALAGGLRVYADLSTVRLTRRSGNTLKSKYFDLSSGGEADAFSEVLQPGDMLYVDRTHFYEDRAYYTSLVGVIWTVLSSILLYREIQRQNR